MRQPLTLVPLRLGIRRPWRGPESRPALWAAVLLVAACDIAGPEPPNIDLSLPWTTASVADVGGSARMVEEGLKRAGNNDRLLSLLVVKDGRLVVERYFGGAGRESLHDVRSVTKSVVSALAGIVIARGDIPRVEHAIGGYLDSLVSDLEPEKAAITIEQLLTMTGGFRWDESGGFGDYLEWIHSNDHLDYLLRRPLVAEPGTLFTYNSAAVHLLGVVLEQATGMDLPQLADEVLFGRIGVSRSSWEPLAGGFHNGGAGLDLRPRDLARFGQLYLQRGASGTLRVIPADWTERSTASRFGWRFDSGALLGISYGFLWWVVPEAREPLYLAWGYGGQYVVVVPMLNLVLVTTTDWRGVVDAGHYQRITLDVLVKYMIPAFR